MLTITINSDFINYSDLDFLHYDVSLPQSIILDNEEYFFQNHTRANGSEIYSIEILGTWLSENEQFKIEINGENYYNPKFLDVKQFNRENFDVVCIQMNYVKSIIVV